MFFPTKTLRINLVNLFGAGRARGKPALLGGDLETADRAWEVSARLAERFKLSVYDAAYLELAQRRQLPLATLDKELRTAATASGVEVLGIAR